MKRFRMNHELNGANDMDTFKKDIACAGVAIMVVALLMLGPMVLSFDYAVTNDK